MDFNRIISGMVRAAMLDTDFYEEVEHDESRTQEALIVVLLVAGLSAIGAFVGALFTGHIGAAIGTLIATAVIAVVTYYIWVFLIQFVGTNLFKGNGDFGQVQRTLGFAYAPRVLGLLSFIPILGPLIGLVAWIWSIATGFVATRQSLDQDNTNAALTVIVATIVAFLINLVFGVILGVFGLVAGGVFG